eukprot:gene3969-biopygen1017
MWGHLATGLKMVRGDLATGNDAGPRSTKTEERVLPARARLQVRLKVAGVEVGDRHQEARPGEHPQLPPREEDGAVLHEVLVQSPPIGNASVGYWGPTAEGAPYPTDSFSIGGLCTRRWSPRSRWRRRNPRPRRRRRRCRGASCRGNEGGSTTWGVHGKERRGRVDGVPIVEGLWPLLVGPLLPLLRLRHPAAMLRSLWEVGDSRQTTFGTNGSL